MLDEELVTEITRIASSLIEISSSPPILKACPSALSSKKILRTPLTASETWQKTRDCEPLLVYGDGSQSRVF